jgi:hypothetical protein
MSGVVVVPYKPVNSTLTLLRSRPKDVGTPYGPGGFIASPIYPANDPTTLVGFIFGKIHWDEVMEDIFPDAVGGIDCVFSTVKTAYTYTITNGSGVIVGPGDLHDPDYDKYRLSTILIDPEDMANSSYTYQVACYPNGSFDDNYRTDNPTIVAVGAVLIVLFSGCLLLRLE